MKKLLLLLVFVALFFVLKVTGLTSYLSFDVLKASQASLQAQFSENPVLFVSSFFGVYVLATAFSLPGATILTLAGGAIFGLWQGFVIVSFASSLGATLAFLVTRYVLRDSVEKKFKTQLQGINEGIKREGSFYLFTLRLVPLFPFFLINMLMGLTQMRVWVFYIVSQVGMILGTLVYVNAGTQLAQLDSGAGILTPKLILSFVLLGIFPLLSKKLIDALKARKVYRGFKKPDRFDYNLVAIGAGAAGLVTTYIGAAVKAKVALIEKHKMGGDCLNTGCVPSKALIKSAKLAQQIKQSEKYGLKTSQSTVDFKQVIQRVHKVIEEIAPHDSIERYTGLGVECLTGEAEILSPWEVKVGDRVLRTKNIVLATGAGPLIPPIPGLREIKPLSSENLWEITSLPQRLLVLGGGPIGCELSQAFSRLGSQVTQVEVQESLLVREDSDVSKLVTEKFKAEGINLLLGHKAESFGQDESGKFAQLKNAQGVVKVYFDEVIVALGRKANTNMKGLERLGLELNPSGTFAHDEYLRTKYPNVFVCGDCAGPYQFTHVAAHQAWYASVNALFSPFKM
ncbi:MAG: FAD-dependent oxidoreductase, partial [Proteobacteria bacterium]|nr:FAD-dependent oxidoreductase [Pseudomonadota bacterium]